MLLRVYGSGSTGNTYTLTASDGRTLVLDAGVRPDRLMKDIGPGNIDGVLITHEHGDHSAYINRYKRCLATVYGGFEREGIIIPSVEKPFDIGGFSAVCFGLRHDVPCLGYLINHKELLSPILYCTDTNGIPYDFDHLSLAMIEANYDKDILMDNYRKGIVEGFRVGRVTRTHNSLSQAISFLREQVESVTTALLCHLSHDNSDGEMFRKRTEQETGIRTHIANAGLELEIGRYDIFK